MTNLQDIFEEQTKLMSKIYEEHKIDIMDPKQRQMIMKDLISSIMVEAGELMNETKLHKHWTKKPKLFDENFGSRDKVEEELIDVWLFLIEASLLLNLSAEDIFERYKRKVGICETRIKENY